MPFDDTGQAIRHRPWASERSPKGECRENGVVSIGGFPTALYRHARQRRSARVSLTARERYCRAISGIIMRRPSFHMRSEVEKPTLPRNLLDAEAVGQSCSTACWIWPRSFVMRSLPARAHMPVLDRDTTAPRSVIDSAGIWPFSPEVLAPGTLQSYPNAQKPDLASSALPSQ